MKNDSKDLRGMEDKICHQSSPSSKARKMIDYNELLDQIEAFIMTMLYRQLFSNDQTNDEQEDLKVQVSFLIFLFI